MIYQRQRYSASHQLTFTTGFINSASSMLASASRSQSSSYMDSWLAGGKQASSMMGVDGIGFGGGVIDPSRVGVLGSSLGFGPAMVADSLKI